MKRTNSKLNSPSARTKKYEALTARRALVGTVLAVFILAIGLWVSGVGIRNAPPAVATKSPVTGTTFSANETPNSIAESIALSQAALERSFIARDQFLARLEVLKKEAETGVRSEAQLVEAVSAMIDETGDKHAELATVEEYETWLARREGKVVGLDFDVEQNRDGNVFVTKVPEGSSAAKAGVKPGDEVVNIDEYHIDELKKTGRAVQIIGMFASYGVIGSKVDMRFRRGDAYLNVAIERVVVKTESPVKAELLKRSDESEPLAAYMRLSFLEADDLVEKVVSELETVNKDGNLKGMVLRLESVAGGDGEKALKIAALFVKDGVLGHAIKPVGVEELEIKTYYVENGKVFVKTKGPFTKRADGKLDSSKKAPETVAPLDWKAGLYSGELVVSVNSQTSGCAELIASALKSNRRAAVVGSRTAGKGLGQTVYRVSSKYVLVFSTSSWLAPDGWAIEDISVNPTVPIDPRFMPGDAAMQVLNQKLRLVPFPVLPAQE